MATESARSAAFFLTQHVVEKSLVPHISSVFVLLSGWMDHYIIVWEGGKKKKKWGHEHRMSLYREATRLCGWTSPRATADPHTAHKERHTQIFPCTSAGLGSCNTGCRFLQAHVVLILRLLISCDRCIPAGREESELFIKAHESIRSHSAAGHKHILALHSYV